jgi:aminopeptidase N
MLRCVRVALVFLLFAAPAAAQRLPGTVLPEHYTLSFTPDLEKETFRGRESIRVTLTEPTTSVTLHAAEIQFGEVTITAGGRTQKAQVTTDPAKETATFTVPERLAEGQATIEVTYTGALNDKLRGFYISKANGRKYAVTQLEATDARRAFPSFDEPIYKATYDISLTVDAGDTAISNGPQLSDTPGPEPGKHTLTFERTPKMSSYLVAMVVGDFVCRSGSADGTPLRVCSTPDKRDLTAFALEAASVEVKFFNRYFGIKYPFKKLDLIGVPDFSAGAMENAGAITFRDRLLLLDPSDSSITTRLRVASVISHEIAHQWFGDLVTMRWWDDIWLNEGFATWMQNKPLASWHPEWHVDRKDTTDTIGALSLDSLASTRPIRFTVETPDEINEVFDAIAYQKTAGVLRMVESYVGPESFRRGVASYLKKFSYGNAAGTDFWTEVARVTAKPVDRIMRSFVDQIGAPVITVRNKCVGTTTQASLSVDRFFGSPTASSRQPQAWVMPVCFTGGTGAPRCELIDRRETTLTQSGCGPTFVNADSRGYYLSDYAAADVRALAKDTSSLKPIEWMSLLGDEWRMVRSGRHDVDLYLDVASALSRSDAPEIVEMLEERLGEIDGTIASADERPRFEEWVRTRFASALTTLGLPGDPKDADDRQRLRATLLSIVGVIGNDASVQRRTRELAEAYIANPRSLSGTLAGTVLRVAALRGDRALYDQYVAQLSKTGATPELHYRFFNALPWFSDPMLARRTLEYAASTSVRSQDAAALIGGLLGSSATSDIAWEFVQTQWPALLKRMDIFQGIPDVVESLGGFCSPTRAAEIKAFFAKRPEPAISRTLQVALERIDSCVALRARQGKPFSAWLRTAAGTN